MVLMAVGLPVVAQQTKDLGLQLAENTPMQSIVRPPPAAGNLLECGGRHGLTNSTVKNYTSAKLVLSGSVRGCIIESVGPVEDGGQDNRVTKLDP